MKLYALLAVLLLVGCSKAKDIQHLTFVEPYPTGKGCWLPNGQPMIELPSDGGVTFADGFTYVCFDGRLEVTKDPLYHGTGMDLRNQVSILREQVSELQKHVNAMTRPVNVLMPTTGAAIAANPGSIANSGTVGSITVNGRLLAPDIATIEP